MDYVHFLNLEYFLLLVYGLFTGAGSHVDISQVPYQILQIMTYIAWAGLGVALIFLFLLIWTRNLTHAVEHEGWHAREHHAEEAAHHVIAAAVARNPQWEHVKQLMLSPSESDWRRAIIEADIILDQLLSSRGYSGGSIGDKLKAANPIQFTTLDLAWAAHKVRNDIAHGGSQFTLTEREARGTIDQYRRVFEEFDYI